MTATESREHVFRPSTLRTRIGSPLMSCDRIKGVAAVAHAGAADADMTDELV